MDFSGLNIGDFTIQSTLRNLLSEVRSRITLPSFTIANPVQIPHQPIVNEVPLAKIFKPSVPIPPILKNEISNPTRFWMQDLGINPGAPIPSILKNKTVNPIKPWVQDLDINPKRIHDFSRQYFGPFAFNKPTIVEKIVEFQKHFPMEKFEYQNPVFEFWPQAVNDFFVNPKDQSRVNQLERYLSTTKSYHQPHNRLRKDMARLVEFSTKNIKESSALQEICESVSYRTFNEKKFLRALYQCEKHLFKGYETLERAFKLSDLAVEMAPSLPAVNKFFEQLPSVDKRILLGFTSFVAGLNRFYSLTRKENLFSQIKNSEQLQNLFEKSILLSAEEFKRVALDTLDSISDISDELRQKFAKHRNKICMGIIEFRDLTSTLNIDDLETWELAQKFLVEEVSNQPPTPSSSSLLSLQLNPPIVDKTGKKFRLSDAANRAIELPVISEYDEKQAQYMSLKQRLTEEVPLDLNQLSSFSKTLHHHGIELNLGKVIFANGIWTMEHEALESSKYISDMGGGIAVDCNYNGSQGPGSDIINECRHHYNFVSTTPVELLKNNIIRTLKEKGKDYKILIVAHSQGALITRNALLQLPIEARRQVQVVAVNPAAYIDDFLCDDILHLVSKNDWLARYFMDPAGRERCKENIEYLDGQASGFWGKVLDHGFKSLTIKKRLNDLTEEFTYENG